MHIYAMIGMYLETEKILYGHGRSFASIRVEGPRITCPYHQHPEVELVCLEHGKGRLFVGDHTQTVASGDTFLLGANLPHIFQIEASSDGRPLATHVIQFREDFAGEGLFQAEEMREVMGLLRRAGRGLQILGRALDSCRGMMAEIHAAAGARRLILLLTLLAELAESRSLRPLSSAGYDPERQLADPRMSRVVAYIHEHLTESLTVSEVARVAGLTPNAFCRYFRSCSHRTFTDFVNELRVREACRLLQSSGQSVARIAFECGFGNLAHFHKEFRKRTGFTPGAFRAAC